MIDKRKITLTAVAGLAIAASGAAVASATGSLSQTAPTTIKLVERGGGVRFIDNPPRARHQFDFSPGDLVIVTRRLDDPNGRRAGSIYIACVAATATRQQCTGTATLDGGTLEVAGLSQPTPTTTVAVVGGTSAYAGARVTSTAKDRPGRADVADMTIQLTP